MLRDVMRETREFPYIAPEEQAGELPQRFQQAFVQGLQQAQREHMQDLRHVLLKIVRARFPQALRLARKQVSGIEDYVVLRDLIVKMSTAKSVEEAVNHLLETDEEQEEEE